MDNVFIDQLDQLLIKDDLDNKLNIYEVSGAIAQMNGGNAPSQDGINAELVKCRGNWLNEMLHEYNGKCVSGILCSRGVLETYMTIIKKLLYSLLLERFLPEFF